MITMSRVTQRNNPVDNSGRCPCCKQPIDREAVLVSLDNNRLAVGWSDETVRLTRKEAVLVDLLIRRMPGSASDVSIIDRVWPELGDRGNVTVLVFLTRRKIAPLGLRIINTREVGYRLEIPPQKRIVVDGAHETADHVRA